MPTRFGDEVTIETAVVACGRSSIKIEHRLAKAGVLAVEGFETRVFVAHDPADPERIKSQPIPPDIAARLTAGLKDGPHPYRGRCGTSGCRNKHSMSLHFPPPML